MSSHVLFRPFSNFLDFFHHAPYDLGNEISRTIRLWNGEVSMERKRKVREVILHIPETDARIVIEGIEAFLWADGTRYEFGANSQLLILLIENRNREVSRAEMKKTKGLNTEDKIVPNSIGNIRKKLKHAGMPDAMLGQFLEKRGEGENYRAKLNLLEEDIIYGEEYCEEKLLPSGERRGWDFPTIFELAGIDNIRTDYLPRCLFQGKAYPRLESCVMEIFKRNSEFTSPLIVSAVGGAGKTFSMLHLYAAAEFLTKSALYVHADCLEDEEHNLLHYICRRYFGLSDRNQHQDAFDHFAKNADPVLLLIDGMNEVSVSKQEHCCRSFNWMQKNYPKRIRGVFATRFPQWLKARLYQPLESQLLPLDPKFLQGKKLELIQRLQIQLTPLLMDLLERMSSSQLDGIQTRYDLYRTYFDDLADRSSQLSADGWVYNVLACIAARSMEGQIVSNRWLKEFCAGEKEYGFIHSWCAGEEYPLDHPSSVEKLKATGFLLKGSGDSYTIHQQYRDYLAVRYGLLEIESGQLSPAEFLRKIIDATRYYTLTDAEDPTSVNLRRHNNMDLGEFGFYAGLSWYYQHGKDPQLVPLLLQLGIQVAYLYDNVHNLAGLYDLHCRLDGLLTQYLQSDIEDMLLNRSLPGYYFCLNKLVSRSDRITQLSSEGSGLILSEKLEDYYKAWLAHTASQDSELRAVALSGLGGVYLARYRIVSDFESKNSCLDQAIQYHGQAMEVRRQASSPKLYLSYAALGTDWYYKGSLFASRVDLHPEAAAMFREAAAQHLQAVEQPSNYEKYVSWTRMAGCWYRLLLLTPEAQSNECERCRQQLLSAVKASVKELKDAAVTGGIIRLSGEIRTLIQDVSNYLGALNLETEEKEPVEMLCELYTQAFPMEKKPVCMPDRILLS